VLFPQKSPFSRGNLPESLFLVTFGIEEAETAKKCKEKTEEYRGTLISSGETSWEGGIRDLLFVLKQGGSVSPLWEEKQKEVPVKRASSTGRIGSGGYFGRPLGGFPGGGP